MPDPAGTYSIRLDHAIRSQVQDRILKYLGFSAHCTGLAEDLEKHDTIHLRYPKFRNDCIAGPVPDHCEGVLCRMVRSLRKKNRQLFKVVFAVFEKIALVFNKKYGNPRVFPILKYPDAVVIVNKNCG